MSETLTVHGRQYATYLMPDDADVIDRIAADEERTRAAIVRRFVHQGVVAHNAQRPSGATGAED
ncbi:MAG: hypothetical protein DLM64_06115 [Solirubrobacterales bacterium]|nr:MAG: hypothetical protein DLM64_06115 [Solirubrobacterales bacterium]